MKKTTATFKKISTEARDSFPDSSCLFTNSVGQATHEGERFLATIQLINNSFKSCVMLVDDTLQRHTMALNSRREPEDFYEISLKEGDLWLERNNQYYNQLTIPTKIIRWDYWLNHPEYPSAKNAVISEMESSQEYKNAFYESVENFLVKYRSRLKNPEEFNMDRARSISLDFVIEQCSALCLWVELGCHYEAYPNEHNSAIQKTREKFVLSKFPNLLKFITIKFRNAGQVNPQLFYTHQEVEAETKFDFFNYCNL